jgi:hypothetical protein
MIALSDMQSYFCRSHTQSETPSSLSLSPFPSLAIHALRALKLAKPESESTQLDATAALANGCRRLG